MYTEQERNIFGPIDRGDGQEIFVDPVAAYRRLALALQGEQDRILNELGSEEEMVRLLAEDKAVDAARQALGLLPFEPETGLGATDQQALDSLRSFSEYLQAKKEQGEI